MRETALIPDALAPMVEAIGLSATMSVVHVYAGARLKIPDNKAHIDLHPLTRILGGPLMQQLVARCGGEFVEVPFCQRILDSERDRQILERWREGWSAERIAAAYAMHMRSVFRILARARNEFEQQAGR